MAWGYKLTLNTSTDGKDSTREMKPPEQNPESYPGLFERGRQVWTLSLWDQASSWIYLYPICWLLSKHRDVTARKISLQGGQRKSPLQATCTPNTCQSNWNRKEWKKLQHRVIFNLIWPERCMICNSILMNVACRDPPFPALLVAQLITASWVCKLISALQLAQ